MEAYPLSPTSPTFNQPMTLSAESGGTKNTLNRSVSVADSSSVITTIKNAFIRLTHPPRKFLADMVVCALDVAGRCTTAGSMLGYGLTAEVCNLAHVKHDSIPTVVAKTLGSFIVGGAAGLGGSVIALPAGVVMATKNLLSGQTIKTAAKGSVEDARHVGWMRIIDNVDRDQDRYNDFTKFVDTQMEMRAQSAFNSHIGAPQEEATYF
ncbi:hypothetical protein [Parendozoicomonas sp. Alg238-R29]|uniref:hypothetical protein n=1 Tax=Parendozoicomonas sp. Alg238-R29 TaxID=2993446 RepID=UPI00248F2EA5|nr:hypothetical protein [Parendozoicomonas sp. Alg238-R29]